jgi:hypothetical protein
MPSRSAKQAAPKSVATRAHTFLDLFENVRARPGMYLPASTYVAAAAWVEGYDRAHEGGVLTGFREWLVVKAGGGNNLYWFALVLELAFPKSRNPQAEPSKTPASEKQAIDALFRLISEFWVQRSKFDGLLEIYRAYDRWLRRQSWYEPPEMKAVKRRGSSARGRASRAQVDRN